jgi:hypothetical protein
MTIFNLSSLFKFKVVEGIQFPCNFEFECIVKDDSFNNPGIFFLYYRKELIYIGFTNNNQDVISERVVRQIATITLRDHRIHFTPAALNCLIKNKTFDSYFNSTQQIVSNKDFVTSVNRVEYAAYHWDEFKNFNLESLSRFEIAWYPNPNLQGSNSINELCQQLKNHYKPRCNKEYTQPLI